MKHFTGITHVGLREKGTGRLIAVYPEKVSGNDHDLERKVFDWYYRQDCGAEDRMKNYYVDGLTEKELASVGIDKSKMS